MRAATNLDCVCTWYWTRKGPDIFKTTKEGIYFSLCAAEHKVSISIWWLGELWNLVTWLYREITSVIPTTWWKTSHQTIILQFPFPRHLQFVLLTPDYVSLCVGIDTSSSFLLAAAPWKAVWEDHNVAFIEAFSQRYWFNYLVIFEACVFWVFSLVFLQLAFYPAHVEPVCLSSSLVLDSCFEPARHVPCSFSVSSKLPNIISFSFLFIL